MKKISLLLLFLLVGIAFSQPPNGSKSLIHTQTARTFDSGRLEVHSDMNFFTRATEFIGNTATPADFKGVNYWLVAGNLALTYGVMDNLDITLATRLYQDTHYENEYNMPDDIFLTVKGGSFAFANRRMYGALMATLRFPTGEQHNYPFTEYASGAVEYAFTGALSFFTDPYLPERSFNAHLNLGWWNHNEIGKELFATDTYTRDATVNSQELQYAFGLNYPTALFDYNLEVFGTTFLQEPDKFVYSRENYAYITPSIRYKAFSWASMDLGVDIRLAGKDDKTSGVPSKTPADFDLPNYASWRVHMGLNLTVLPFTTTAKTAGEVEREEFNKRVEFFQKIVEERQKSEDIQEELDRLKQERQEAENELEELKQIMEEQD